MKKILSFLLFFNTMFCYAQQTEDWYGPVRISFHGFICNRPTNDDPLGGDGVSDEVTPDFWVWSPITTNRAAYAGIHKIYGENFLLPNRIKAGTATINGGIKAGDNYYREGLYDDNNLNSLGNYDIVNTFCSNSTYFAIFPALFERDEGPLHTSPFQNLYIKVRQAFADPDIQDAIQDFSLNYTYNDNNPYGFFLAGRHIGLDARFAGMFSPNKNKLASRPIGLFSNWDYSSQLIILTPKTIKIIAEKDYGYGKGILPVHFNEESMGNTEGHGNYIVLLRIVADIKDRNANNPASTLYSVGVKVNNAAAGEEFKFRFRSGARFDSLTIRYPNTYANFTTKIASGQQYYVTQTSGPRSCQLTNFIGTISKDTIVTANCSAPSASTSHKIGISYGSSLFSNKEIFEFILNGGEKIQLSAANPTVYFNQKLRTGETYRITQVSGPRTCGFFDQETGTISNQDVVITASCGNPPLTIYKANYRGIETGESFSFADGHGRTSTIPFSATNRNLGGFPVGDSFTYKQTGGPRPCIITPNKTIVTATSITIDCDCRKPAAPHVPPKNIYDLVTRSSDDKILNTYYESWAPVIGGKDEDEGRYVAFSMYGNGIDGSSGKFRQIFWRDRKTGITKLVSKAASGEEANASNFAPAISADGKTVAFESYATNLSGNDNNGGRDVYAWNEQTGTVTLISKGQQGNAGNGESYEPSVSGDGSTIAYTSYASDIVKLEPVFSTPNVYVYNQGSTVFITKDHETGRAASGYSPSISEDGSKVVFCAYTGRLVKDDNNNLWDIFLWQSGMPDLKKISLTSTGAERNQGTESSSRVVAPSISGDGNYIVYATTASNMVAGDTNQMQDIFICNTSGGDVRRMSMDGNGDSPISQGERIGISYGGEWITYNTNADNLGALRGNIVLQNTVSGKIKAITNIKNGSTARPMVSANGNYVIAGCSEPYDKRFPSSGIFVFYTGHSSLDKNNPK